MQPAPTPAELTSRLSRLRLGPRGRRVLIVVLTLWLLSWLFLGLLGPSLVRNAATGWAQGIGRSLSIGEVTIHPWNMSLEMRQVTLKDRDGSPLFAAQSIRLDAIPRALLIGHWHASLLALSQPQFNVVRDQKGVWNWARLIADASGPRPSKGPAPKILLDLLSLSNGQITLSDRLGGGERRYDFARLNLNLHDMSTLPTEGDYLLSATLDNAARLKWRGRLGLSPLSSSGRISLNGLPLPSIWPYVAPFVHLAAPTGNVSVDLNYVFDLKEKDPHLTLSSFFTRIDDLRLRSPDGHDSLAVRQLALEDGIYDLQKHSLFFKRLRLSDGVGGVLRNADGHINWQDIVPASTTPAVPAPKPSGAGFKFQINDLRLENWKLNVEDRSFARPLLVQSDIPLLSFGIRHNAEQGLSIERATATLKNLNISAAGQQPAPLTVAQLQLSGASLTGKQVQMGALTLQQPSLQLERGTDGRLNLASLFAAAPGVAKPAGPSAWKVVLPRFGMSGGRIVWHDASLARPVQLQIEQLAGDLTPHSEDPSFDAALSARIDSGSINLKGSFDPGATRLQGALTVQALPLAPLAPYALAKTPLGMSSGTASGTLDVVAGADGWSLAGQAGIANLLIREPGEREPLLGWRALTLAGLKVSGQPLKVAVRNVVLDHPQARLVLDQNRVSNLRRLFGGQPPAATAAAAAPAGSAAPGVSFDVRMIHVRGANVDFADQGMKPAFGARINNLSGTVSGLSSRAGKRGAIALNGTVDQAGDVRVRGALAPLAVTDNADVSLLFRNIALTSLNTYSENIAGWEIVDGRLSVDLHYQLNQRKLNGDNRIVVDSIKLGKQVERPGVSRLPLSLAVAVLEDSRGRIDLRLPVSGDLDDPKFSYSGLVWQAFVNVIQKVVTAPFRALGAMLGVDGFDDVRFVAGETAVTPPERQKLGQLTQMLVARPQLDLRIAGTYDPAADRAQLARARIDHAILAAAGVTLSADEPLPAVDVQDVEMQAAIKSVFAQHVGRLKLIARTVSGSGKPDFYAALRQEAIDNEPVSTADLVALANARAKETVQYLRQTSPTLAARVQVDPIKTVRASADGVPLVVELANH